MQSIGGPKAQGTDRRVGIQMVTDFVLSITFKSPDTSSVVSCSAQVTKRGGGLEFESGHQVGQAAAGILPGPGGSDSVAGPHIPSPTPPFLADSVRLSRAFLWNSGP